LGTRSVVLQGKTVLNFVPDSLTIFDMLDPNWAATVQEIVHSARSGGGGPVRDSASSRRQVHAIVEDKKTKPPGTGVMPIADGCDVGGAGGN
jgi:hypothetical protein